MPKIEGVPVLRAGQDGNIRQFIKEFSIYAVAKYHDLGSLIETRRYYETPPIEIMELRQGEHEADNIAYQLTLEAIKQDVKM